MTRRFPPATVHETVSLDFRTTPIDVLDQILGGLGGGSVDGHIEKIRLVEKNCI